MEKKIKKKKNAGFYIAGSFVLAAGAVVVALYMAARRFNIHASWIEDLPMMILMLPLKLFARLLLLICIMVRWLVRSADNYANIGISLLMLFVLGCGLYTACHGQWSQTLRLFQVEVGCMAVLMCTHYSEVILDKAEELLEVFIHI